MDVKGSKAQGGNEDDAMLFDRIAREQKKRKKCSEKGTENAEWGHENFYVQKGIPLWLVLFWWDWFRRSGRWSIPLKAFPDYWALTVHMCDTTFSWYICV